MRSDMHKLLVERPREGGYKTNWRTLRSRMDRDDASGLPLIRGMRRLHRIAKTAKEQTDHLNPLYRFLLSRVGCKWDDVYSEIRRELNMGSAVQYHVLQHLNWWVERNVSMVGDVPYSSRTMTELYTYSHNGLRQMWVDPRDGTLQLQPLKYTKSKRRHWRHYETDIRTIADNFYCKVRGVWFQIEFCDIPRSDYSYLCWHEKFYDMLFKDEKTRDELRARYGGNRMPSEKRQLNKNEIRRLRLNVTQSDS